LSVETLIIVCLIGNAATSILIGLCAWIDYRSIRMLCARADRLQRLIEARDVR
jgi:hypothetical protein